MDVGFLTFAKVTERVEELELKQLDRDTVLEFDVKVHILEVMLVMLIVAGKVILITESGRAGLANATSNL